MRGFLHEIAEDLYGQFGDKISELYIVFPSRRARIFFTEALSQIADRPLWQPKWLTIDDLMSEVAILRDGDRVRLVTELYKIYSEYHPEPFDKFYFWGELLINDFDTIDKYMIDADQLFRNISDLKELEADVSYLTPQQLQIIKSFWASLIGGDDLSEEKRKFLVVWRTLAQIYHKFRARLAELGIAYTGMIQRAAAERIASGEFAFAEDRHYVVAGFNALSECEKRLFKSLSHSGHVDFYWDYDTYYKDDLQQEAGLFMRENLRLFPPRANLSHDNMREPKRLTTVTTPSNAVQCKYVSHILEQLMHSEATGGVHQLDKQTAIVLTDENLLIPVLHSLPNGLGEVNVTMGYPLRQTLAYTFIERLIELQKRRRSGKGVAFYHVDVNGILAHPYVAGSDELLVHELQSDIVANRRMMIPSEGLARNELLTLIFSDVAGWRDLSIYLSDVVAAVARIPYDGDEARRRVEFFALISEHVAKLRNSLDGCEIDVSQEVFASLLRRTLQMLRIPFEGEPLKGVQVMGILETRNLDFENIIILSMNDDNFPGNMLSQPSFIPYNLRAAYDLPTPEHHEGVYAYYFYRLIQRARNVWMIHCSRADEKSTGEPSRYIYQLAYESGLKIDKVEVGLDVNLASQSEICIEKDASVMRRLEEFTTDSEATATLSPTAFSRYVICPLRFYFYSIVGIRPEEELAEEVDNPLFGTILHDAAQILYEHVRGVQHPSAQLRELVVSGAVERAVMRAINTNCMYDADASESEYSGSLLIVKDIVSRYLRGGVLRYDMFYDKFAVRSIEESVNYTFPVEVNGRQLGVKFAGRADRVDSLDDGALRVVDYKTGTPHLEYKGVESLFEGKGNERLPNILQIMLYAMMLHRTEKRDVEPALYYVREMNKTGYSPCPVDRENPKTMRYKECSEAFEQWVRRVLRDIFNPALPFIQCEDVESCKFCDFTSICRR